MSIAIPISEGKDLQAKVETHFGRCHSFLIINEKGEIEKVLENQSQHYGGMHLPPQILKEEKINILLCLSLGPRALSLCRELGISVYVGEATIAEELYKKWATKSLILATDQDVCEEHK